MKKLTYFNLLMKEADPFVLSLYWSREESMPTTVRSTPTLRTENAKGGDFTKGLFVLHPDADNLVIRPFVQRLASRFCNEIGVLNGYTPMFLPFTS
jgi:hypothetical protein